jgi:hypothetical protein
MLDLNSETLIYIIFRSNLEEKPQLPKKNGNPNLENSNLFLLGKSIH